jgi:hypothetical protein
MPKAAFFTIHEKGLKNSGYRRGPPLLLYGRNLGKSVDIEKPLYFPLDKRFGPCRNWSVLQPT